MYWREILETIYLYVNSSLLSTKYVYKSCIKLIYIYQYSLNNLKVPFSIATTLRCRGGRYSFPWIAPLYPWYVPYKADRLAKRYQVPFLKYLVWPDLELNPGLLGHWRTLNPLGQWLFMARFQDAYFVSKVKK